MYDPDNPPTPEQMESTNKIDFTYDDRGNLTEDEHFTYAWDFENRVTTMIDKVYDDDDTTHSTPKSVRYIYDAFGRRVAHIYDGQDADTDWISLRIVYDGVTPIEERELYFGNEIRRFYYSSINDLILAEEDSNDDGVCGDVLDYKYIPLTDDRGTVMGVAAPNGAILEKLYYNSTGIIKSFNGSDGENTKPNSSDNIYRSKFLPFGWTGMYKDSFTGKYHTHFRDYDPVQGRWLSEDPAGYVDGLNLYNAYMGVNGVDPLGLEVQEVIRNGRIWYTGGTDKPWLNGGLQKNMNVDYFGLLDKWFKNGMKGGMPNHNDYPLTAGWSLNRVFKKYFKDYNAPVNINRIDSLQIAAHCVKNNRPIKVATGIFEIATGATAATFGGPFGVGAGTLLILNGADSIYSGCTGSEELGLVALKEYCGDVEGTKLYILFRCAPFAGLNIQQQMFAGPGKALNVSKFRIAKGRSAIVIPKKVDYAVTRNAKNIIHYRNRTPDVVYSGSDLSKYNGKVFIIMHGSKSQIGGMSASQFVKLLKNSGFNGSSVDMVSCFSGTNGSANAVNSTFNIPVNASTGKIFWFKGQLILIPD